MIRVAIIDHANHNLFIEDIDENVLEEKYNGEEEAYIKDMYTLEGEWSWDYITCTQYFPMDSDGTPIEVDFEEIADI